MRVGRDHIASVVDTLVLAYAGASLPLLILFMLAEQPLARILSSTIVAEEIVRTLVGSIGLVASVPVTTALAAAVAARIAGQDGSGDPDPGAEDHEDEHGDGHDQDHDRAPGDHLVAERHDDGAASVHEVVADDPAGVIDADEPQGTPPPPAAEAPAGGGRRARSRRRSTGSGDGGWQPPRAEREFREP